MAKKIMVVDDEPYIARVIKFKLEQEGYTVISANDGQSGLQKIKEEKPDMVLLDVMMPGLSGYEVCQKIREDAELAGIPVVILTAKGQERDREQGLTMGASDYITKPFSPNRLLELVKSMIGDAK
ncbi:MAG: response regulator [Candidatus Edwardsbacteria bacterium]|nr:response regulator [Candidatus Edwardsbacteria bacterium]MBU1577637.1 response regulator [Candidatus Edwardsbacteria bacterium]MBU2463382.1 response regulator [Candidatus Edwardsbacteria bacterium]MDQ7798333.1 response regulator [Candidatus Edwardsbacteria bacterium]